MDLDSSRVCITVSNSLNSPRVYIKLCKHGVRFCLETNRNSLYIHAAQYIFTAKYIGLA